jgi:hypothetical protein
MSDTPTPLAPPAPPTNNNNDDTKKYLIFFLSAVVVVLLIAVLLANRDISKPAAVETTTTVEQVENTVKPTNKYDDYYQHVMNNSGKAQTELRSDVIELGDLVCGALDKGNTFSAITSTLGAASSGQSDNEYFASIVYGAVKFICPEYYSAMSAYLGN